VYPNYVGTYRIHTHTSCVEDKSEPTSDTEFLLLTTAEVYMNRPNVDSELVERCVSVRARTEPVFQNSAQSRRQKSCFILQRFPEKKHNLKGKNKAIQNAK
jgi:hypothetical protein